MVRVRKIVGAGQGHWCVEGESCERRGSCPIACAPDHVGHRGWALGAHWRTDTCRRALSNQQLNRATPDQADGDHRRKRSQSDISAKAAPFEQTVLSKQCGSLRNMHALTHGSEPNYIGMTSGNYPSWALCDQPPNTTDSDCARPSSTAIYPLAPRTTFRSAIQRR